MLSMIPRRGIPEYQVIAIYIVEIFHFVSILTNLVPCLGGLTGHTDDFCLMLISVIFHLLNLVMMS